MRSLTEISFSYPYTAQKLNGSSIQKKKQNPYSIGLIEDTHQSMEASPSGIGNMSDEVLSSLFACKQNLANQKFELKINDIRFVSHPALMENKNTFILINIVFALQAQCSYSIGKEIITEMKPVGDLELISSEMLLRAK
jgi:nitrogen permease regulator 3-like protein